MTENNSDNKVLDVGEVRQKIEEIVVENGFVDPDINITIGSQKGDNYLGKIYMVKISNKKRNGENSKDKVLNLILKVASQNDVFRNFYFLREFYQREIFLYVTVLPIFEDMQQSRGLDLFKSYTKVYKYSLFDKPEFLIMQNEKNKGFQMTDRKLPLDIEHCKIVFIELGKYHALSYAFKKQNPEKYQELAKSLYSIFMKTSDMALMRRHYQGMAVKALTTLQPENDAYEIEKFAAFTKVYYDTILELTVNDQPDEYSVITYGDTWTNNILYKYDDPNNPTKPTDVLFLDWQLSRFASPVTDLSYFIYNCTDEELRDKHFDYLIELYYTTVGETLKLFDCDINIEYPRDVFNKHMIKYFKYGLTMACNNIYFFTSEGDQVPDMEDMKDVSVESMESNYYVSKNIHIYIDRVRGIIKHAIQKGFI